MNSIENAVSLSVTMAIDVEETNWPGRISEMIRDSRAGQLHWFQTPLNRRLGLIRQLRHLIADHALRLAEASALPRHRPVIEAMTAEVMPLLEACRFLERCASKLLAPRRLGRRGLPLWLTGVRIEIHREPLGIVLIIGPGNYPLLLPGVQMIQALTAGNAVMLKPGLDATPAARALVQLVLHAGFDPRLIMLLPESEDAARAAIDARPDKVLFTGSADTGVKIQAQLAPHLVPSTMELSGCDAVLIRRDADLDLAAKALAFGLTLNNGATCLGPKRVFVVSSSATELEGRLANIFQARHPTTLEPAVTQRLRPLLTEALAKGGHLIAGRIQDDGSILAPVIIGGAARDLRFLREDVFAPVLALVTVSDDQEGIALANDCPFALGASIFSRAESTARALATRLHAGVVTINDLIIPTADARVPFGGRQRSGFGVTRGGEGLLELTTPKVVTLSRSRFRPAFAHPQAGDAQMFASYLRLTHGCGIKPRMRALAHFAHQLLSRGNSLPKL